MPSLFVGLDSVAIITSGLVAHAIILGSPPDIADHDTVAMSFVWLTTLMLMNFAGLYKFEPLMRPLTYVDKIIVSFVTTFLFLLAAAFALKISATFSRIWIVTFAIASCSATLTLRIVASVILNRVSHMRVFTRDVVIAGGGNQIGRLLDYMTHLRPPFVSVVGVFVDNEADVPSVGHYAVLGTLDDVADYARRHRNTVDDVIIALPWSGDERLLGLVNKLRELAINVYLASDLAGFRLNFQSPPDHFGDMPIFEVKGSPFSGWNAIIKGAEDYIFGTLAALVFLPLMLLIAIAIKLDSKGPVLFRQKRLGFLNQEFEIYKFRTMRHETCVPQRTVQATRDDTRVTRVGRVLRHSSLDELPNLINVLNGTMSLVGPRPHAVDHNREFSDIIGSYFVRHRVKPGLTGWAQVNGFRGATDTRAKIEGRVKYDIYYAENWSFWFDVQILLMTVVIVLTGRNAY
jgi:Undecaprenyl-phosphate glucose phosphotransferase